MVQVTRSAALSAIVLVLVLGACGRRATQAPSELPSDVEKAVKETLSMRMGVAPEDVEVVQVESREWPDACLGVAAEDEVCAQVITPGWRVTVRAEGEEYVLRTDEAGAVVRME